MPLTEKEIREVGQQMRCPNGELGLKVAMTMYASNLGMTVSSIDFLEIQDAESVLEMGHGNCKHLSHVLDAAKDVHYFGLEISDTMCEEAAKNNAGPFVQFKLYDGKAMPYSDASFDKLFTVNTIYFWERPQQMLEEIDRVLKPGAICVITYGNKEYMQNLPFVGAEFNLYNREMITELVAKSAFEMIEIKELHERIKGKKGEEVDRSYTMVKLKKGAL